MTNNYWLSRMNGNPKTIEDLSQLDSEIRKYSTEYQTVKLKRELHLNWGLKDYGTKTRGFYVSFDLSMKQLILEAEKKRINYREKEYKRNQEQAEKEVLIMLNKK